MSLTSRIEHNSLKQPENLELVLEGQRARSQLNLEYLFDISHGWEFNKEYSGGLLKPTISNFEVRMHAKLLFSPLGDEKHNYEVALNYFYTPQNKEQSTQQKWYLAEKPLQEYCEKQFPHLGIYGTISLGSTPDLPGDTSGKEITRWFFLALDNNPDIQRVSKAHKLLIEALLQPNNIDNKPYSIQKGQ